MMHRLRRYDVFRFAQNDVAPLRSASDAMFASMCRQARIIRRSRHHLRDRQTSFKKRTFVGRQKCVFCCQRAVKRCVNAGKNSKKYTKSKLFNASKKVRFVLWDKRLHICFTCAKRNYTFQKTSVIISPDIYLQGIFGQFLFIWIFILLGFFCKINYV